MGTNRYLHWCIEHSIGFGLLHALDVNLVARRATNLHFLCSSYLLGYLEKKKLSVFRKQKAENPAEILSYACALMTYWSGLYGTEMQGKIMDGVKLLLSCASRMTAQQQHSAPPLLLVPSQSQDEDAEEDSSGEDM